MTIPIELKNGTGITRDVSGLGVYFTASFPFEAGEQIDFVLRVPGSINVHCSCEQHSPSALPWTS